MDAITNERPLVLPIHEVIAVGEPAKLALRCAPKKREREVKFMMLYQKASPNRAVVTCNRCLAGAE